MAQQVNDLAVVTVAARVAAMVQVIHHRAVSWALQMQHLQNRPYHLPPLKPVPSSAFSVSINCTNIRLALQDRNQ